MHPILYHIGDPVHWSSEKSLFRAALKLWHMGHQRHHMNSHLIHRWLKWVSNASHIFHHGVMVLQILLLVLQLLLLLLQIVLLVLNVSELAIETVDPGI